MEVKDNDDTRRRDDKIKHTRYISAWEANRRKVENEVKRSEFNEYLAAKKAYKVYQNQIENEERQYAVDQRLAQKQWEANQRLQAALAAKF